MKIDISHPSYEQDGKKSVFGDFVFCKWELLVCRFRVYEEDPQDRIQKRVKLHYEKQHTAQTVQFVKDMVSYANLSRAF